MALITTHREVNKRFNRMTFRGILLSSILLLNLQFDTISSLSSNSKSRSSCWTPSFLLQHGTVLTCCLCGSILLTTTMSPVWADVTPEQKISVGVQRIQGFCVSGVGDACDNLAQGNSLIQQLQRKSALQKEQTQQEYLETYNMKNFPDYFASMGKVLVKKISANGSSLYVLLDDDELNQLKKNGKIQVEIAKAMGGRVIDFTSKPRLVWRED